MGNFFLYFFHFTRSRQTTNNRPKIVTSVFLLFLCLESTTLNVSKTFIRSRSHAKYVQGWWERNQPLRSRPFLFFSCAIKAYAEVVVVVVVVRMKKTENKISKTTTTTKRRHWMCQLLPDSLIRVNNPSPGIFTAIFFVTIELYGAQCKEVIKAWVRLVSVCLIHRARERPGSHIN